MSLRLTIENQATELANKNAEIERLQRQLEEFYGKEIQIIVPFRMEYIWHFCCQKQVLRRSVGG